MQENALPVRFRSCPISTASSCGLTKNGVERIDEKGVGRIHEMGLIVMKKRWVFCPALQENPISTASSCGLTKKGMGFFCPAMQENAISTASSCGLTKKGVERIDEKGGWAV